MSEQIDHIEELQKRLYARDPESVPKQKFGILRPMKQTMTSVWGQKDIPPNRGPQKVSTTGYRRFFVFSVIFFLIGLGLASFSIFRGAITLSSKNVDLTILGNSFIGGGEELPIQVEIANKNSSDLVDAVLTLEYPKGAIDETGTEMSRLVETLGTIGAGKSRSVGFSTVLYGEQGLSRTINATLSYHLAGSTATFEKKQSFSVMISSSPITLTVDAPSVSAAEQPFTVTIRSVFNGDQSLVNPIVRVEYPTGFTFLSSTPKPLSGNNVWSLGTLEKGQEFVISFKGKLSAIEGDERAFRVYLGTPVSDIDTRIAVAYNSTLHSVLIEQPFIAADILVGGDSDDVVSLPIGSAVRGAITWRNMTGRMITNPVITLLLSGQGLESAQIEPVDGYYDELLRTITWTGTSDGALATIEPGESGRLEFVITPSSTTAKEDIRTVLSVEGVLPDFQNEIKTVSGIDEVVVRFAARLQFASQALYSIGSIKNSGPFPPKANQETSYTVTWTVKPTENPISNAIATATLPTGVTWAGVIVPQSEALSYNQDTRELRWNIGSLPKATATALSKTVSFQIKARPTISQVNTALELLSEAVMTADDAIANVQLRTTRPALSTSLVSDPAYSPGEEKVIP